MPPSDFQTSGGVGRLDPRDRGFARRDFLYRFGQGVGAMALSSVLADDGALARLDGDNPLAPKGGHHPPRAKSCIFLFMSGAPGQMDTFDPKPKLAKLQIGRAHV